MRELVGKKKPDLILLDVGMPNINGLELLEDLHAASYGVPVIMTSASHLDDSFSEKARALGAIDYIILPVQAQEAVNRILPHLP